MRIAAIILVSFLASTQVYAEGEVSAPVGLAWGMSGEKLITEFSSVPTDSPDELKLYKIENPPIKIPDFDLVYGAVDNKYGLVRVVLIKKFVGDIYGHDGFELYKKYKEILKGKYGKPDSFEYIGKKLYKESDEFYQCLSYGGCGAYTSFFPEKNNSGLYIELKGYGRGVGALRVIYESGDLKKIEVEKNNEALEQANKGL